MSPAEGSRQASPVRVRDGVFPTPPPMHRQNYNPGTQPMAAGIDNRQGEYHLMKRAMQVEFPKFDGDNLRTWIFKSQEFFEVDQTPEEMKVQIAAMHFGEKASEWYQGFLEERDMIRPSWNVLLQELQIRFQCNILTRPVIALKNLKQLGGIDEYNEQFESLMNRCAMTREVMLDHYLGGLKEEIVHGGSSHQFPNHPWYFHHILSQYQHLHPNSFHQYLQTNKIPQLTYSNTTASPKAFPPNPNHNLNTTIKRPPVTMSKAEMEEKRRKGLFFYCNERFTVGHKCRKGQSLMTITVDEEELELVEEVMDFTEVPGDDMEAETAIFVHALTGVGSAAKGQEGFQTMRVTGLIKKLEVMILIDSGSIHNFIDVQLAKRLRLKLQQVPTRQVMVANGSKLLISVMCKQLQWTMSEGAFQADFLVMPLGSYCVVLGVQWLSTLGDIRWNFGSLTMEFKWKKQLMKLQGQSKLSVTMTGGEKADMNVSTKYPCMLIQIIPWNLFQNNSSAVTEVFSVKLVATENKKELELLLEELRDVFEIPTALPPIRTFDHKIILKEGAEPFNQRPYRYGLIQKDVIEEMVREMLSNQIIRPSSSPFASPVVLVKKKKMILEDFVSTIGS
ncbi:Ty3/gypsy retrotransposon protein [Quillaja saponaria]|uniref:Ty3/gypsy retrotransposon protein n=1 Tax=Quillaja saponaria TaxID=32244 RepID=A0AAD7PBM9_QUISA|nr:Ty3/gypsy retrotransposon protein [Quillaja saponaria]